MCMFQNNATRIMHVSDDGGDRFEAVNAPTVTPERVRGSPVTVLSRMTTAMQTLHSSLKHNTKH